MQAGHGQSLQGQLQGTGLIRKARARGARSHVADDQIKGAQFGQPGLKGGGAPEDVLLHEEHLGRERRFRALDVAGQDKPLGAHFFRDAQGPGTGGGPQIQHFHARLEQTEFGVQLFQLVDRAGRIIFPLGFEEIMVAIFLHKNPNT